MNFWRIGPDDVSDLGDTDLGSERRSRSSSLSTFSFRDKTFCVRLSSDFSRISDDADEEFPGEGERAESIRPRTPASVSDIISIVFGSNSGDFVLLRLSDRSGSSGVSFRTSLSTCNSSGNFSRSGDFETDDLIVVEILCSMMGEGKP